MMSKKLSKYSDLSSICKEFKKKSKNIKDIVIYGSAVKGKLAPRDIDVIMIFSDEVLETRMQLAHELKTMLGKHADVKQMVFEDFFDSAFLARQGILLEGISLITGEKLAQQFGFEGYALFSYSLEGLTHTKKVSFEYALSGRGSNSGVLKDVSAKSVGKGAILVPVEQSVAFEDFLSYWKVKFVKKYVLVATH